MRRDSEIPSTGEPNPPISVKVYLDKTEVRVEL